LSSIGGGLVVLLGVGHDDDADTADALAERIAQLRIFRDDQGRTNRSLVDVRGEALIGHRGSRAGGGVVQRLGLILARGHGRSRSLSGPAWPDGTCPSAPAAVRVGPH
jgi:hypothetical protein